MTQRTVTLKANRNYPDVGTVGRDLQSLAANVATISDALDIAQRNTGNVGDSYIRVSELVALGLATLVQKQLTVAFAGAGSFSTVALLPDAKQVGIGARSFVTDATATTFHSIVAGGGTNKVPVVSDGTNWLIG